MSNTDQPNTGKTDHNFYQHYFQYLSNSSYCPLTSDNTQTSTENINKQHSQTVKQAVDSIPEIKKESKENGSIFQNISKWWRKDKTQQVKVQRVSEIPIHNQQNEFQVFAENYHFGSNTSTFIQQVKRKKLLLRQRQLELVNRKIQKQAQALQRQNIQRKRVQIQRIQRERMQKQRIQIQRLQIQRVEAQRIKRQRLQSQILQNQRRLRQRVEIQRIQRERRQQMQNLQRLERKRLEQIERQRSRQVLKTKQTQIDQYMLNGSQQDKAAQNEQDEKYRQRQIQRELRKQQQLQNEQKITNNQNIIRQLKSLQIKQNLTNPPQTSQQRQTQMIRQRIQINEQIQKRNYQIERLINENIRLNQTYSNIVTQKQNIVQTNTTDKQNLYSVEHSHQIVPQMQVSGDPLNTQFIEPEFDTVKGKIHYVGKLLLYVTGQIKLLKQVIQESQFYKQNLKAREQVSQQYIEPLKKWYRALPKAITQSKCQINNQFTYTQRVLFLTAMSAFVGIGTYSVNRNSLTSRRLLGMIRNTLVTYTLGGLFIAPQFYYKYMQTQTNLQQ